MSFLDGDPIVTCKYCGEEGLQWSKASGEWRLHEEDDEVHVCGNGLDHDSFTDEFLEDALGEPTDAEWSEGESTA